MVVLSKAFLNFFFFYNWSYLEACGACIPRPEIQPMLSAVEALSLNHWTTRETPQNPSRFSLCLLSPLPGGLSVLCSPHMAPGLSHTLPASPAPSPRWGPGVWEEAPPPPAHWGSGEPTGLRFSFLAIKWGHTPPWQAGERACEQWTLRSNCSVLQNLEYQNHHSEFASTAFGSQLPHDLSLPFASVTWYQGPLTTTLKPSLPGAPPSAACFTLPLPEPPWHMLLPAPVFGWPPCSPHKPPAGVFCIVAAYSASSWAAVLRMEAWQGLLMHPECNQWSLRWDPGSPDPCAQQSAWQVAHAQLESAELIATCFFPLLPPSTCDSSKAPCAINGTPPQVTQAETQHHWVPPHHWLFNHPLFPSADSPAVPAQALPTLHLALPLDPPLIHSSLPSPAHDIPKPRCDLSQPWLQISAALLSQGLPPAGPNLSAQPQWVEQQNKWRAPSASHASLNPFKNQDYNFTEETEDRRAK